MAARVVVIDTSLMCCWLQVAGKETAGSGEDVWDYNKVDELIRNRVAAGATLVLPMATLIETGNHVAQAPHSRYEKATSLMEHLIRSVDSSNPWAAFGDQDGLWEADKIRELVIAWPALAAQRMSIGDATIKSVADYYSVAGLEVEIATADVALKAYEPRKPVVQPRRRR
ncbi:hypothetical protein [Xanthomonas sacchari]|uniref:hypothetical protein n=1 Tax=Xanthomonas sacchari TaxID=56458 RepID=UPI002257057B|nr:hypothetical protein [Xanthomonas sacchari]